MGENEKQENTKNENTALKKIYMEDATHAT